jgi:hypothetical protein
VLIAPHDAKHFKLHARWSAAVVLVTVLVTAAFIALWVYRREFPGGGRWPGLILGTAAALIIAFEVLLWPRKRWRGGTPGAARTRRWVATYRWMAAHVWLGALVVPLTLLHSGFPFGSPLTSALMVVFFAVVGSGVYVLVLQQVIPRRMLDEVPDEVPAAEIDRVLCRHTDEFAGRLRVAVLGERTATVLGERFEREFAPYLRGEGRDPALAVRHRAEEVLAGLRQVLDPAAGPLLDELTRLCDLRRQFDAQARLHARLHRWVPVHLGLSVALVGLLLAHIVTALRYI